MADDSQNASDSLETTDDREASVADKPAKGGSSVLKLIGIALGLTVIAGLILGGMFWKTLNDSASRANSIITADEETLSDDSTYGEESPSTTSDNSGETSKQQGSPEGDAPELESTEPLNETPADE